MRSEYRFKIPVQLAILGVTGISFPVVELLGF